MLIARTKAERQAHDRARKAAYRARLKAAGIVRTDKARPKASGTTKAGTGGTKAGTKGGTAKLAAVARKIERFEQANPARELTLILENPSFPAAARVQAARTLAELEGRIGRHQAAPERDSRPIAALSRDELIGELDRLRTLFSLGLVR